MPKKVRRRWCASFTILLAAIGGVAINCGRSGGGQGSSGNVSELIPAGWDGKSDWESKRWIVADLDSGTAKKRPASTIPGQRRKRSLCGELTSHPHESQGRFLVRVKLFQGGALYASLAGNPRIRQMTLRPSPEISELTLEAFSLQEVEDLARKFHGHSAGCAGVELLSAPGINLCGTQMANGVIKITPPVFDETIKLSMVDNMLPGVIPTNIRADMTTLQGLGSRYYNGSQALSASNSVQTIMTSTYAGTGWSGLATTNQVSHSGFTQRSVVSSLPGLEENDTTIIIGSHLDSIHPANQADAPGADDNASGVAVMAEVMRVLSRSNTRFKRRVEWHAYGIEEIGLVGSGQIASNYAATDRKVAAMLQLDMAAYAPEAGNETIHLFHDDTTTGLRRSVKDLLTTYLGGNFTDLGLKVAGTSDHRSWYRAGYPTVFPFEDTLNYNRNMHTPEDTIANANSPALSVRMVKLVIAFLSHHAGIAGADADYDAKMVSASRDDDIKVAIVDADQIPTGSWPPGLTSGGTVTVFSGPESLAAIEACEVTGVSTRDCASDRTIGTKIEVAPAGRSFFYIVSSGENRESRARTFGYGQDNSPTHARSISITRK